MFLIVIGVIPISRQLIKIIAHSEFPRESQPPHEKQRLRITLKASHVHSLRVFNPLVNRGI